MQAGSVRQTDRSRRPTGQPGPAATPAGQLDASGIRTVKTLALFSGPVALDGDGGRVPLALPDFNGQA
ncbi:MAG: hypothetical protein R3F40_16975 [Candidatus Competibacteraceae bacterium]